MYIDSGKDLKIDKITSPRVDQTGPGRNQRTQLTVKQSPLVQKQVKSMKTTGSVNAKGDKSA